MAIQSFGDKTTETFYLSGIIPRNVGWRALAKVAARKLDMLNYAKNLDDLKAPPSNPPNSKPSKVIKGLIALRRA